MLISENITIRDLGLYLIKEKTLIISDIHIGFEESLNRQGVQESAKNGEKFIVNILSRKTYSA